MKKHRLALLVCVVVAGCTTVSEVVPMGKDSYTVSVDSNGGNSRVGASRIGAVKAANAYCQKQGKFMIVRNTETTAPVFGPASSNLIFSCVTADDPEYQRPNLRPTPGVVIQDQRQPH